MGFLFTCLILIFGLVHFIHPWHNNYWTPWRNKTNTSFEFKSITDSNYDYIGFLEGDRIGRLVFYNPKQSLWKFVLITDEHNGLLYDDKSTLLDYARKVLLVTFPVGTILDSNLDMIFIFMEDKGASVLRFEYLTGLDLEFFSPLRLIEKVSKLKSNFYQFQSTFSLYDKQVYLMTPDKCSIQTYERLLTLNHKENLLGCFSQLSVADSKNQLCKHMFQNISLDKLIIKSNNFELLQSSEKQEASVNASIKWITFSGGHRLRINSNNLDPDLFRNSSLIEFFQVVLISIQTDLFSDRFDNLHRITLRLFNLKAFLHGRDGVAWIKAINSHIPPFDLQNSDLFNKMINYVNANKKIVEFQKQQLQVITVTDDNQGDSEKYFPNIDYAFPDRDFCLFHDIPQERLVFILVDPEMLPDGPLASCLVASFFKYSKIYQYLGLDLSKIYLPRYCHFTKMSARCNVTNSSISTDDLYPMFLEIGQDINEAKIVLIDYMLPAVCGLCLITNTLIVLTIAYNNKRKSLIKAQPKKKTQEIVLLDEMLYKYIMLNAILNLFYSLVTLADYLSPCHRARYTEHDYEDSRFPNVCITREIVFDVIGDALKLVSNFSFLQISVNRYLLVGKGHLELSIKIANIRIRKFLIVTVCLSVALSSYNYFQANFFSFSSNKTPIQDVTYTRYNYVQDLNKRMNGLSTLSALTILHDVFSYFLFCLLSLLLDIMTVKKLHDALLEKEKIKGKDEKSRDSERRSIIMVVANSLVNFILRAPELVSVTFYYILIGQGKVFVRMLCFLFTNCPVITDLSKSFCIFSMCFSLLFYIKFNSVFRFSFYFMINSFLVWLNIRH